MILLNGRLVGKFGDLPTTVKPGDNLLMQEDYAYFVFETPMAESAFLNSADRNLAKKDGEIIALAEMPHLIVKGMPYLNLTFRPNCFYEIYIFMANGKLADGCLITTNEVSLPEGISYEAAKLFALMQLNIYKDIERAKNTKVLFTTSGLVDLKRFVVWFTFDDQGRHHVRVNGEGAVVFSRGDTWQSFQQFYT